MSCCRIFRLVMTAATTLVMIGFGALAAADEQTPEQMGVEGTYVRVATNQEGWVVLGYRIANESVGKEWMLLDLGMTLTKGTKSQKITRDHIKLVTPNHEVISLPTQEEFEKVRGSLAMLVKRAAMTGDSINYFPAGADLPCRIGFFADPGTPGPMLAYDEVELSPNRACLGRVYFQVPGGIQLGNYNLDVKFENSILKVPMEIMTDERAKEFTEQWKEWEKKAKKKDH